MIERFGEDDGSVVVLQCGRHSSAVVFALMPGRDYLQEYFNGAVALQTRNADESERRYTRQCGFNKAVASRPRKVVCRTGRRALCPRFNGAVALLPRKECVANALGLPYYELQ
jgi:hypothetical protein